MSVAALVIAGMCCYAMEFKALFREANTLHVMMDLLCAIEVILWLFMK